MKRKTEITLMGIFIVVCLILNPGCEDDNGPKRENPADMPYFVRIDPENFESTNITGNTFFPIDTGKTYIYEGEDEDGATVRVEEEYTGETKIILGVTCVVVNAKEYVDGELIEDTDDWYAQDREGNVWYFGEASREIEDGEVVSTAGSWEAGVDGALPGIIMLANTIPGIWYRQEYYAGEAEDVGLILSIYEAVTVPYGSFTDCLQIAEWNLLEPGVVEHKFYAAGVGQLRAVAVKGESGYEDLVDIE